MRMGYAKTRKENLGAVVKERTGAGEVGSLIIVATFGKSRGRLTKLATQREENVSHCG